MPGEIPDAATILDSLQVSFGLLLMMLATKLMEPEMRLLGSTLLAGLFLLGGYLAVWGFFTGLRRAIHAG